MNGEAKWVIVGPGTYTLRATAVFEMGRRSWSSMIFSVVDYFVFCFVKLLIAVVVFC